MLLPSKQDKKKGSNVSPIQFAKFPVEGSISREIKEGDLRRHRKSVKVPKKLPGAQLERSPVDLLIEDPDRPGVLVPGFPMYENEGYELD